MKINNNKSYYISADVSESFCGYYVHCSSIIEDDETEELIPFGKREDAEEYIAKVLTEEYTHGQG